MANLLKSWKKWFQTTESDAPQWATDRSTAFAAISLLESRICSAVLGGHASLRSHNLFGQRVLSDLSGTDPLGHAAGLAVAGLRVALFPSGTVDLARLKSFQNEGISLVIHLNADATDPLALLMEAHQLDLPLLIAENGSDAVRLALTARAVAETWLSPVVLISRMGCHQAIAQPNDPQLAQACPAPSSATASGDHDRFLFGKERSRVPALFHPAHATATGLSPVSDSDRTIATTSRSVFFGQEALAAFAARTFADDDSLASKNKISLLLTADASAEAQQACKLLLAQGIKLSFKALRCSLLPLPVSTEDVVLVGRELLVKNLLGAVVSPPVRLWQQAIPSGLQADAIVAAVQAALKGKRVVVSPGLQTPRINTSEERAAFDQEVQTTFAIQDIQCPSAPRPANTDQPCLLLPQANAALTHTLATSQRKLVVDFDSTSGHLWIYPPDRGRGLPDIVVLPASAARLENDLAWKIAVGGRLIISDAHEEQELALPSAWQTAATDSDITLEATSLTLSQLALLIAKGEPFHVRPVTTTPVSHQVHVPSPLRQRAPSGGTDDLARLFALQRVPRRNGDLPSTPDPFAARGWSPAGGNWLYDQRSLVLPEVEAARCSGCGDCSALCPDSAIVLNVQSLQSWLDAANDATGLQNREAAALKRQHRKIVSRLAKELTQKTSISEAQLTEAFDKVIESQKWEADALQRGKEAAKATIGKALASQPMLTSLLWSQRIESGDDGWLLSLAVDNERCTACGICMDICPENALYAEKADKVSEDVWQATIQMQDTDAGMLDWLDQQDDTAPGWAYSRHLSMTVAGGEASMPGSGGRIALRSVLGAVEHHAQKRQAALGARLDEATEAVQSALLDIVQKGLADVSPDELEQVIADGLGEREQLSTLMSRLADKGEALPYARQQAEAMAASARLARASADLLLGRNVPERARYGLVALGESATALVGTYPDTSVSAPCRILDPDQGSQLPGIVYAWQEQHLDVIRSARRAEIYAKAPSDLPRQMDLLADLTWQDLDEEEKASAPVLVILANTLLLSALRLQDLTNIGESGIPLIIVTLASFEDARPAWPLARALNWPAISAAVHQSNDISRFVADQLAGSQPAFLALLAPEPDGILSASHTVSASRDFHLGGLFPLARQNPDQPATRTPIEADADAAIRWLDSAANPEQLRTVTETGSHPELSQWLASDSRDIFWFKDPDAVTRMVSEELADRLAAYRDACNNIRPDLPPSEDPLPVAEETSSAEPPETTSVPAPPNEEEMIAKLRTRLLALATAPGAAG